MWENGSIPKELGWTVFILIKKENTDTWGVGLLEVVLKVAEVVIDTQTKSVFQFHNVIHEFCAGGGSGTTIIELKLAQELASAE